MPRQLPSTRRCHTRCPLPATAGICRSFFRSFFQKRIFARRWSRASVDLGEPPPQSLPYGPTSEGLNRGPLFFVRRIVDKWSAGNLIKTCVPVSSGENSGYGRVPCGPSWLWKTVRQFTSAWWQSNFPWKNGNSEQGECKLYTR